MSRGAAVRAGAAAVAMFVLLPEGAWAGTVKVESKNMQRAYKRTSTRGGVRLKDQLSREACVQGISWGFDRDGIWVDQGCRAVFETGGPDWSERPSGRTVTVESRNQERYYYRISTRGGVRLFRQISRDACVEGVSWGFDRDGIWVDKGCRAEFEVGSSSSSGWSGGGSSGGGLFGGPQTVKVESKNQQRTYRRISTRGGVRLKDQLSRDACVEGISWGFDRDGIWVDKGCRAEFQIGN